MSLQNAHIVVIDDIISVQRIVRNNGNHDIHIATLQPIELNTMIQEKLFVKRLELSICSKEVVIGGEKQACFRIGEGNTLVFRIRFQRRRIDRTHTQTDFLRVGLNQWMRGMCRRDSKRQNIHSFLFERRNHAMDQRKSRRSRCFAIWTVSDF